MSKKPLMLCILDGFGWVPNKTEGNAIVAAKTPNLDKLFATCPYTTIGASGMDVGLPDGQMGNSEVGHTNIGAGRIVYQELTRITKAIQDGSIRSNEAIVNAMKAAIENGKAIHLMGLLSAGGVHGHIQHLFGLLDMAKDMGATEVYVHAIMDGRDVPPDSGKGYIDELQAKLDELGVGKIASISGRYYAMDRDNRWDRVEKAYAAFVYGEGVKGTPAEVMANSYAEGVTDEFVVPAVTCEGGRIAEGDTVIFYNFRPDRAREITRTFVDDEFTGFERKNGRFAVNYVCFTQYDATMPNVEVAFKPQSLTNVMGEYLAKCGKTQLRIAETEKYAHVTFFFNGGVEAPFEGEDRALIASPKVATYDLQPEMSAFEVADECVKRIESGKYDVIILNFANCDMVGHTGIFEAAVKAVEAVDTCAGKVIDAVLAAGGQVLLTADHGNADQMREPDGAPFTAHTTNPVPFLVAGAGDVKLREGGVLADIAPTMLKLMGLAQPEEMTGKSIIE
ncbi:2,3-bisphosphoglycerate-independent phosphoglycerate mutase [Gemmiger sp. An50]|uniref:2,3-bisphosphoglycerate-independent phosphoglycerate mutase n=1 Tax=Gemmiger sp. An50 TaxID=1965639 RepID=UPI000B3AF730|nr:2,3-bisphosphoglycerate-independent phosphoglycerate mutase [Gemmiger sp. An50]OUN88122.1 phosphoglycerate mutase (2,3-diphosphoglycerate-independent) [Gemmiger sp. An50]